MWSQLCVDPYFTDGSPWFALAGKYSNVRQHEIGGGARLWYRIEPEQDRIVIVEPHPAHPKETERKRA